MRISIDAEDLKRELKEIIDLAEWGIANERMGGNAVKEEHWKGQRYAATALMGWLQNKIDTAPMPKSAKVDISYEPKTHTSHAAHSCPKD